VLEEAQALVGDELLRERERGPDDADDSGSAAPAPDLAVGLGSNAYGAPEPFSLLLVPATSGPAALAALGWSDGNTFGASSHVAITRHLAEAYGAQVAAVTFSTIELVVDTAPTGDALDRATADRRAYGDATFGTVELDTRESVRRATGRDLVWGFWFD
jgi:hypothetical protein